MNRCSETATQRQVTLLTNIPGAEDITERGNSESPFLTETHAHPNQEGTDPALWEAILRDAPQHIKGTEDWFNSNYMAALEDHPDGGKESLISLYQFCIMQDLKLAWAAAQAVFGDHANSSDAWEIHSLTSEAVSKGRYRRAEEPDGEFE